MSLNGSMNVSGATALGSTLVVSGATALGSTLVVNGDASFNSSRVDICGNFYAVYPDDSIPASAIIGDVGGSSSSSSSSSSSNFTDDVSFNETVTIYGDVQLLTSSQTTSVAITEDTRTITGSSYGSAKTINVVYPFGLAISLDGNTIISGRARSGNFVDVYQYNGSSWSSTHAFPNATNDNIFGKSIATNKDGTMVAIASGQTYKNVYVYRYDGSSWSEVGELAGPTGADQYGHGMAFNDDGDILAIGGDKYNNKQGVVQVFQYFNNDGNGYWSQVGQTLYGSTTNVFFGQNIGINGDGTIIAASAPNGSNGKGEVYAYRYSNGNWSMMGSSYVGVGNSTSNRFGHRVRLSEDGTILTASAYGGTSFVKSFTWNGSSWSQRGGSFGYSNHGGNWGLDMSRDGTLVGVSNYGGGAQIFEFSNNSWSQKQSFPGVGRDILLAMDQWGTRMTYGSENNSSNAVRVYDIAYSTSSTITGYEDTITDVSANMLINGNLTVKGDLIAPVITPSSSSDTGTAGQVAVDESYIYICTATDTWKRVALSSW